MSIIVYEFEGKVYVVTLCGKSTPEHYIATHVPPTAKHLILTDTADLPAAGFRNAWFINNNKVEIDINKAKEIKRNQFRQARRQMLTQLDVEYLRAVETSNASKKKSIAATKKQLRDVTSIDLPDDVSELVVFWPDVLKSA
jgi:hypothetical protein